MYWFITTREKWRQLTSNAVFPLPVGPVITDNLPSGKRTEIFRSWKWFVPRSWIMFSPELPPVVASIPSTDEGIWAFNLPFGSWRSSGLLSKFDSHWKKPLSIEIFSPSLEPPEPTCVAFNEETCSDTSSSWRKPSIRSRETLACRRLVRSFHGEKWDKSCLENLENERRKDVQRLPTVQDASKKSKGQWWTITHLSMAMRAIDCQW